MMDSTGLPSVGTGDDRPWKRRRVRIGSAETPPDAAVDAESVSGTVMAQQGSRRPQPQGQGQGQGHRQRTRAAMACFVCRGRKTKCDGRRPSCGYCQRTRSDCQYDLVDIPPDLTLYHDVGPRILHAVEHLTRFVKDNLQPHPIWADRSNAIGDMTLTPSANVNGLSLSPLPLSQTSDANAIPNTDHLTGRFSARPSPHLFASSEGLESVLEWHVFPPCIPKVRVDNGTPVPMPDELPPITFPHLNRLQKNYRRVVHNMNPMLDLATLDQYVTHVSENGLDSTTRTCLVALVCAIGALCQEAPATDNMEMPSCLPVTDRNHDVDIAYRFWSVASKRIGRAMSQNTLESAQCLCLAGIWFMCNLQPLDAWKHFTMAGNCCYAAILARKSMASVDPQFVSPNSQAIEQSIFYTAYKSELEIRYELAIPGSVLEHIEDQLVFPSPPILSEAQLEEPHEEAITWYYYLSDIAARHLINRIINAGFRLNGCPTEVQAQVLLRDYKIFSSQLEDWYESLPQEISFDRPDPSIEPEANPFKMVIRSRYMFISELLCRPFVRICLNYALDLPEELISEITSIASLGLQFCTWRLQSAWKPTRLDHGTWIGVRNHTANAAILIGASRRDQYSALNVASRLWVPENWRPVVERYLDGLEVLSEETRGGVKDCYELIRWGLDGFEDKDSS